MLVADVLVDVLVELTVMTDVVDADTVTGFEEAVLEAEGSTKVVALPGMHWSIRSR